MNHVFITKNEISILHFHSEFSVPTSCGAVVWFEGRVRAHNQGKSIHAINYECYQEMAEEEIKALAHKIQTKWGIEKMLIAHRTGELQLGEISFVVALCSAHRKDALKALDEFIDCFKKSVPIWKQEFDQEGNYAWL